MPQSLVKQLAFSGKNYNQILQALEDAPPNFSEESLASVKDKINQYIFDYHRARQVKLEALNQLMIGSVLTMLGLTFTAGSYSSSSGKYLLAYGLILGGAWIFKEAYKIYILPLEDLVPKKRRFKRFSRMF